MSVKLDEIVTVYLINCAQEILSFIYIQSAYQLFHCKIIRFEMMFGRMCCYKIHDVIEDDEYND